MFTFRRWFDEVTNPDVQLVKMIVMEEMLVFCLLVVISRCLDKRVHDSYCLNAEFFGYIHARLESRNRGFESRPSGL